MRPLLGILASVLVLYVGALAFLSSLTWGASVASTSTPTSVGALLAIPTVHQAGQSFLVVGTVVSAGRFGAITVLQLGDSAAGQPEAIPVLGLFDQTPLPHAGERVRVTLTPRLLGQVGDTPLPLIYLVGPGGWSVQSTASPS